MTDPNQANQVLQGDCLELMKEMPDDSVDMILADIAIGLGDNNVSQAARGVNPTAGGFRREFV